MTNKKLLEKLQEDMEMRGFSHYTKDSYYRKAKEILEYFGKPMNQVTTKELREFLIQFSLASIMTIKITRFCVQKLDIDSIYAE